jgi:threonine dehydrogenase-like Zn-dependent dehydrogenase
MRALTIAPGQRGSARLDEIPEPNASEGPILVEAVAVGVCGADRDLVEGAYGWAPPGRKRLVIGHESLGRVIEAPADGGFARGDLIVGIVRHPDPVPCVCCAAGDWDACKNGKYTEHGIKERDGFCRERYRLWPGHAVKVDPSLGPLGVLLEPATIVAKAWEHVEHIGLRSTWDPKRALITGAGPVGLLAALMGVQRGLDVHVLDRVKDGPKPELVRRLGATYHSTSPREAGTAESDVIIECTGAAAVIAEVIRHNARSGIVCLAGLSPHRRPVTIDLGELNQTMVLENDVVFGSVNANLRHYQKAADALARADRSWLDGLIARRVPLARWSEALEARPGDVKTVIEIGQ